MSQTEFAVNFFVALFALIDPIGNVPMFAARTSGAKAGDRARIALYISLFVLGFLTLFFFSGLSILKFFGISLPAFRIAGGVILFMMGLQMTREDLSKAFDGAADGAGESGRAFARKRFESLLVPFAMPLLIGPGAISTVIIYASQAKAYGVSGLAAGVGAIAAVSVATLLSFLATPLISRLLGHIGLMIVVRVLGLILCALAVQFILSGFADSTAGFIRPGVASPYGG